MQAHACVALQTNRTRLIVACVCNIVSQSFDAFFFVLCLTSFDSFRFISTFLSNECCIETIFLFYFSVWKVYIVLVISVTAGQEEISRVRFEAETKAKQYWKLDDFVAVINNYTRKIITSSINNIFEEHKSLIIIICFPIFF